VSLPIQGSRGEEIGEESGGPACAFVGDVITRRGL
jgi:hypothetical protein